MDKPLFYFLFLLFFNFYSSQDLSYMFDGEAKLQNTVENAIPAGNIDNGLSILVNIDNKNYKFLIDTGASVSVLNDKTFKLDSSPKKIKVQDAFGIEAEKDLFYIDFKIGNNQFSNFAFVTLDFSKFLKNNCSGYDGILGSNVIRKLNWKFLRTENQLFFSKNEFNYDGFKKPFKLQWSGNIPIVELKIDTFKFLAIIDSGHFGTILIPDYIYKNNYNDYYQLVKAKGNPISGASGVQKSDLKKAHFKNLKLEDYDLSHYEGILMMAKPNIGNAVIFENGFVFNFLKNEMAFGISKERSRYENLPKLKICRSEDDKSKIEVCFFWNESSNKMLKLHDQVVKIDDIDTKIVNDNDFCSIMHYLGKNGSKKIFLKRGHKEFEYIIN